ncbi:hypothetical protein SMALB_0276 [Streptomyces malaysiensis]|uniref:Periplasmic binding protein/LacI sugar binding domain-containing protein n=1 Tax=Streptomyces malaysiensis TaxID=92644 RepID=A0A7X5WWM5_STRMQ|nr:hypothetical protein [Streptomyces malaysiensis]
MHDLIQSRTAGVNATLTLSRRSIQLLEKWDIPVVFVDSAPPEGADRVPSITTDNIGASMKVGAHLAGHGYTDWLFLAYPAGWSTRAQRERGLCEAASAYGATLEVLESENDTASAYGTLSRYLDTPGRTLPRVIIAGNNPMVHGALRVLQDRAVKVPDEVAIVAFDEFPWAPLLDSPLTVLNTDAVQAGERSCDYSVCPEPAWPGWHGSKTPHRPRSSRLTAMPFSRPGNCYRPRRWATATRFCERTSPRLKPRAVRANGDIEALALVT